MDYQRFTFLICWCLLKIFRDQFSVHALRPHHVVTIVTLWGIRIIAFRWGLLEQMGIPLLCQIGGQTKSDLVRQWRSVDSDLVAIIKTRYLEPWNHSTKGGTGVHGQSLFLKFLWAVKPARDFRHSCLHAQAASMPGDFLDASRSLLVQQEAPLGSVSWARSTGSMVDSTWIRHMGQTSLA